MMMISKRTLCATATALTLSLGAHAMQQDVKDCKGAAQGQTKSCLDVAQDCNQDARQDCSQDVSQLTCQFAQVAVSQTCTTSQVQCGACFDQSACSQVEQMHYKLHGHEHYQQPTPTVYQKIRGKGKHMTQLQWQQRSWTQIASQNVKLNRVALHQSTFDQVDLNGKFHKVYLNNSTMNHATLAGQFERVNFFANKINHSHFAGDFHKVRFDGSEIRGSTFSGKFRDFDAMNALLEDVTFSDANFNTEGRHQNNFDGSTLRRVSFVGSDLRGVTFRGALLEDVVFPCSDIHASTYFTGAKVMNAQGQWVALNAKHLRDLGAHMSQSTADSINLTAWARGYQNW